MILQNWTDRFYSISLFKASFRRIFGCLGIKRNLMGAEETPSITIAFADVPLSDFEGMSREGQVEAMREWFLENYENPV